MNKGKERVAMTEELSDDDRGSEGSYRWWQQQWRKLRTMMMMAEEAANGDVRGEGSFRYVRR